MTNIGLPCQEEIFVAKLKKVGNSLPKQCPTKIETTKNTVDFTEFFVNIQKFREINHTVHKYEAKTYVKSLEQNYGR